MGKDKLSPQTKNKGTFLLVLTPHCERENHSSKIIFDSHGILSTTPSNGVADIFFEPYCTHKRLKCHNLRCLLLLHHCAGQPYIFQTKIILSLFFSSALPPFDKNHPRRKSLRPPETLATTGFIPKLLRCLIFLSTPCKQELLEIKKAHLHLADRGKKVISSRLPYACQRACKSEPTGSLM